MSTLLEALGQIIIAIWKADEAVRGSSRVGESEMDRQSRRTLAWVCGSVLTLLILTSLAFKFFGRL
jgi:hypothetical protein